MKPRLHGTRSQISSHVWPSANSKTSRARRSSSARPVRLLACLVSSLLSVFVRLMAFGMTAIVVYKWLLQSTSTPATFTPEGHTEMVNAVAITRDGRCAVSASDDCTLRIWDVGTGASLHTLKGHTRCVTAV